MPFGGYNPLDDHPLEVYPKEKDMTCETITITKELYDHLCMESYLLASLEAAGVENWKGYAYALEIMDEKREEEVGDD